MPCENYREALIEAAAADIAVSRELRSHLDACAPCRAAFAEEQQLFAAIDQGLRVTANADVSASLFPRVRAQLSERPVSRRAWTPAFAGIGIAAALVVLFSVARKPARNGVDANPQTISATHNLPSAVNQPGPPTIAPPEIARTSRKHARIGIVKIAPAAVAASTEAEVLIPSGQKQAVDALLTTLQQGGLRTDGLVRESAEKPLETLEVSPLDISPIDIKPLPDVETKSTAPDEKTGR